MRNTARKKAEGPVLSDARANGRLILNLAKNDIKSRYAGSFFGVVWAFAQPLLTILVFWFVFQFGLRSNPVDNVPFILWFAPAYIPWIYFSDGTLSSAGCLYEYHYLVRMIKFPVINLPLVKMLSSLFIHCFFIAFLFVMYGIYGYAFSPMWLQVFYYSLALTLLMTGVSWIVSSVSVFFKDFSQIVNIVLQIGFWATPIVWPPASLSERAIRILQYNPLYYITEGYRGAFISGDAFWEQGALGVYFWVFTAVVMLVGYVLFQKLQPHFADVI